MASQVWQERDTLDEIESFPSAIDRDRINGYAENRLLRHDHHEDVFPKVQELLDSATLSAEREKWAALTYVPANVLGLLSKANSEDLFLEPPRVSFGDDESAKTLSTAWADLAQRSGLHNLALDEIDGAGVNGDAAFKVYQRDGSAVIDAVDISLVFRGEEYFSEYAAANSDRRTTRFPFVATPVAGKDDDEWYVLLEVHEPGRVIYRAYRWVPNVRHGEVPSFASDGALTFRVEPREIGLDVQDYETGLDDPTLLIVHNDRGADAFWGASDYTRGLKSLQDAINYQLSSLIEHGDELMRGGMTVLPEEMRADVQPRDMTSTGSVGKDYGRRSLSGGSVPTITSRKLGVVFEHAQTQGVTRFVQVQAQFEGAMKLLEGLWSLFERLSGLTLDPLFTQTKAPESGRAMRLSRYRDQRRIARRQVRWTQPLQQLAVMALALDGYDAPAPSLSWADSFKLSEQEKAEVINMRAGGKQTMSVQTAIERFDGLTEEQAAQEQKRIDDDGKMARVSSPALFSEASQFADETERAPGEKPQQGGAE